MYIRCIDLETSGEEPNVDIVEVGWTNLIPIYHDSEIPDHWELGDTKSMLVDFGGQITPESMGVHHITNAMTDGMYSPEEAVNLMTDGPHDMILVAHNADSDRAVIGHRGFRWIDTWKLAIKLAPNAPRYKLQVLRYWLKLDLDPARSYPAHRAGPDSYVCAVMLQRMLKKISVEEMIKISTELVLFPRMMFGKHKNMPVSDVPASYFDWILRQRDSDGSFSFDKHVLYTAQTELTRRIDAAAKNKQTEFPT